MHLTRIHAGPWPQMAISLISATLGASSFPADSLSDRTDTLIESTGAGAFSGVVFAARGSDTLVHRAYGLANRKANHPNELGTVFDVGSVAKPMTAVAILQLVERGALSVSDSLSTHLSDVPPDKAVITIHQLLTHSAGLPQYHGNGDFARMSRENALQEIFAADLAFEPGTQFGYSNAGFTVLAAVIEDLSGTTWTDYCKKHIFEPAGMEHTGFYGDPAFDDVGAAHGYINGRDRRSPSEWRGPFWVLVGNGGLVTNATDLFRWHRAILDGTLLSPESAGLFYGPTDVRTDPYLPGVYRGIRDATETIRASYCGWTWLDDSGARIHEKGGAMDLGHNAVFRYHQDSDTVTIVMANTPAVDADGNLLRYAIVDGLQSWVETADE